VRSTKTCSIHLPQEARRIIDLAIRVDCRLTLQAVGEFYAAATRKKRMPAAEGGCQAILTDDMNDGAVLGGVRIVNPFGQGDLTDAALELLAP
jgi:hypothetical protein